MMVRYRAGRSDWRSGGTVSWPAAAKDRLFLLYTTNGRCGDPPTVVVCWLARSVVGWEEESVPRPIGIYEYLLGALGESNTSRALFSFRAFFSIAGSHHPVLLPFFHPPINNRRTPCLRQHCRCQRCRQDHPGHWCRCRRPGEFHWEAVDVADFMSFWSWNESTKRNTPTAQPHTVGELVAAAPLWDEVADITLCPKLAEASVGVATACF